MKCILTVGVVHATMIAFLGPVFKFNNCGFNNMIFERQVCVADNISSMLVPFGAISYACAVVLFMCCTFCEKNEKLILGSAGLTTAFLCCYAYFLATQDNIECHSLGYYFTYIAIVFLLIFVTVYKLAAKRIMFED